MQVGLSNMFKPGHFYAHSTAKDLDIFVVKIRFMDTKRVKLLIRWVSKTSKSFVTFPGNRMDGTDNIEVSSEDYKYWKEM